MTTWPRFVVLCLAAVALAAPASAQDPPMQDEFQISQGTAGYQYVYGVSIDPAGRFVVTWADDASSSSYDAWGRLYDAAGAPEDGEFEIDPSATHQYFIDAAKDQSGRFIVTWNEGVTDIRARRFAADGTPAGASFQVSTGTLPVYDPRVASDSSGNFVVVWTREGAVDTDVVARIFDSSGAPLVDEFVVNAYTTEGQIARGVAMSASGFVVAWADISTGDISILARRFDATGVPLTGDLDVNQSPLSFSTEADIAMSGSGSFVVAWDGFAPPAGLGIFARRYDTAGAPLGGEFAVNTTYTSGFQASARVASDQAGNFIVSWTGNPLDQDDSGVAARRFDRFGTPVSGDFIVNSTTTGYQYGSQVALDSAGTFVVAWQSPDNDSYGVWGRRSGVRAAKEISVDIPIPDAPASVAENGVLEPGETVNVATAWINETESNLPDLAGAGTEFSGPGGLLYVVEAASAIYGTVAPGATGSCTATGTCIVVTVNDPPSRPVQHWDAQLQEALFVGVPKTWTLHLGESFPDVPTGNLFYRFIETLFHTGVTGGCAGGNYCPVNPVTRAQMAVFLLKSKFGAAHIPPPCTGTVFTDVPCTGGAFDPWIEELASLAITGGCGGGLYCPGNTVTRQQMAVFLLKALEGSTYDPPDCTGIFDDVPCTPGTGFSDWIEDLAGRQITGGCSVTPPLYCPTNPNNRGQMAVFLVKTFGLVLYGG
jgi:hypothetical protein